MPASDDLLLRRVAQHAGEPFRQLRGREFTYMVHHGSLLPSTTNRRLSLAQLLEAAARAPLSPGELQDLQGPSYLFAIVTDPRIRTQTR
jgi:hypothetical protein